MKPKMQLSQDVMVTDAFRSEINSWMIDFFGYEDEVEAPVLPPVIHHDANLQAAPAVKIKAKKATRTSRKKTQVQPDMETFSALLEGLEDSFYTMRVPAIHGSWLAKKDVNAIKKLGVYIPTPFELEYHKNPEIPSGVPFPAIASALFIPRKEDSKDKLFPRFAFCIKAAKLPEGVEATRGTPYQFGVCYECKHDEGGKDMTPKLLWAWCWMVVRPDGAIRLPHELRQFTDVIKRSKKGNKAPKLAYTHRQWALPTLAIAEHGRDQTEHEQMMACTFRQLIVWWSKRQSQWSVGVRKDGPSSFRVELDCENR